ncbi:MAG: hypothetical protein IJN75_03700 [Clostridia bacterium]|nr:hypothetical protein [Clostridia bacterium]
MKKSALFLIICIFITLFASCGPNGDVSEAFSGVLSEDVSEDVSEEESEIIEEKILDGSKLVVFGDSITALGSWGKSVAMDCNMEYFNGARGGITSAEGLLRFNTFVKARDPDFVTLCFGMNDLLMTAKDTPKCAPAAFKRNMKKLVEKVRDIGAIPLIVTTNPLDVDVFFQSQGQSPELYGGRDILEWLDTYNEAARELASELECDLIDVRAACDEYAIKQVVKPDGIHLSETGNKVFFETISAYLKEHYKSDPNAERVNYDNFIDVTENTEILPFDKDSWYVEQGTMTVKGGDTLKMTNSNGLWPDAQCTFDKGYRVDVATSKLKIKLTTANVNTSVIIFFDGASPNAYADGQYLTLNPYFKCNTDGYTGDVTANQTIDVTIPISSLPIAAGNVHDGKVAISGAKIYVAGTAYQPVEILSFELIVE